MHHDPSLARRAVACRGWRWMPGMREARSGERYEDGDGPWLVNKLPDLADAATRGCLLELAREAWGDPHLYVAWELTLDGWRWCVMTVAYGGGPRCVANTETEALVLALEAARERL